MTVPGRRIIFLGPRLLDVSSSLPGTLNAERSWRGPRLVPYLALLRVGFAVPRLLPARAVVSYTTVSPLPVRPTKTVGAIGGLFSVALSIALRRPAVSRHPALWSSDFPRVVGAGHLRLAIHTRSPVYFRRVHVVHRVSGARCVWWSVKYLPLPEPINITEEGPG